MASPSLQFVARNGETIMQVTDVELARLVALIALNDARREALLETDKAARNNRLFEIDTLEYKVGCNFGAVTAERRRNR